MEEAKRCEREAKILKETVKGKEQGMRRVDKEKHKKKGRVLTNTGMTRACSALQCISCTNHPAEVHRTCSNSVGDWAARSGEAVCDPRQVISQV